jgi:hypothetical protein
LITDRPPAIDAGARVPLRNDASGVGFIIGPARSGTSLVYKCLSLHPHAAYVTNWQARYPGVSAWSATTRIARAMPRRRRRVWFADGQAYAYGRRRGMLERAFPAPVEGEPVYRAAGLEAPGGPAARDVDPREALPGAFAGIRRMAGGSVLVTKRISNNLRIPQLERAVPGARYLVVIRDGRAVAHSLSKVDWWADSYVWWTGGTPDAWAAEGGDPWELCARNWIEESRAIRAGLEAVDADRVMTVRYEDLVHDPIATLLVAAGHLGLPASDAWRRDLEALSFPDRTDAWRAAPSEVNARITELQREELIARGYAP